MDYDILLFQDIDEKNEKKMKKSNFNEEDMNDKQI